MMKDRVILVFGTVLALCALLWVSGVLFSLFNLTIYSMQYRAIFLWIVLTLIFLTRPLRKGGPKDRLPWYDTLLISASAITCGYIFLLPGLVYEHYAYGMATHLEVVLGIVLLVTLLEAGRRNIGLAMPIVVLFFIFHPLVGTFLPGALYSRAYSLPRAFHFLYLSPDGIFGLPLHVGATIITVFVLFGTFLQATGVGSFIIDLAMAIAGRWRGGPAKVSVFTSAAFGTISGSTVANVVVDGVVTIPLMKSLGYKPYYAAAVEAAASNGGQVMPPVMGAVAFIIAEVLAIPYWRICVYSAIPAILYFAAIYWQIDFEAGKLNLKGLPQDELPDFKKVLKKGWIYFLPFVFLFVALFVLLYSPEKSGAVALLGVFAMSFLKKETRLNPRKLAGAIVENAHGILTAGIACALAGVILGSVSLTGFGVKLSGLMVDISGGSLFLLLTLAALASFLLGMGMSSIPCYIMVSVMVAPAVIKLGVLPIAAHLFVFWWAIVSFVTPPVAIAVYVASSIAGSDLWQTGIQATKLSIIAFIVPFMFCYNPELLLIGEPLKIVLTVGTAFLGIPLLAAGLEGYLWVKTNTYQRLLFIGGGLLLIVPVHSAAIPGLIAGGIAIVWQWSMRRKARYVIPQN